uniref:Uncharacterized protein n=1 Tax=Leptobrachium leishanense TaxID=445787 RepID=A0A8C5PKC7_9ANUR
MLWGCFASAGTGKLQCVQGTMNSLQYQEILDDNVMQSVTNLRLGRRWTFQQDNDPKHTSKSTRAWLQIKGWNILEFPTLFVLCILLASYFVISLFGGVMVFVFGISFPLLLIFVHMEEVGLKKTPMGIVIEALEQHEEGISNIADYISKVKE